jgi:Family of unknown function (DUF6508)
MRITVEGLRTVGDFAHELAAPGFRFGAWERSRQGSDGSWSMPYVTYEPRALELQRAAAAAGLITPEVDWQAWAATEEARAFRTDPSLVASATVEQLAHLVTWIYRSDRFSEGSLLEAFESGHLAAIARRARTLADDPGGT